MKTIYTSRKRRWLHHPIYLAVGFILCLIIFDQGLSRLAGPALSLAKPWWRGRDVVVNALTGLGHPLTSRAELVTDNENLRQRLAQFEALRLSREALLSENIRLRAVLGRAEPAEVNRTFAYIISHSNTLPYDVLIIDIGSTNSTKALKVGDLVTTDTGTLIGLVAEVYGDQSKVRLFSAYGERLPISLGSNNFAAEAFGLGGGNFKVRLPKGVAIAIGDYVRVPRYGLEQILGVVAEVKETPSQPFVDIFFKTPLNLNELDLVEVHASV